MYVNMWACKGCRARMNIGHEGTWMSSVQKRVGVNVAILLCQSSRTNFQGGRTTLGPLYFGFLCGQSMAKHGKA